MTISAALGKDEPDTQPEGVQTASKGLEVNIPQRPSKCPPKTVEK